MANNSEDTNNKQDSADKPETKTDLAQAPTTPKASSDEPKSSQSALDFDV